MSNEQKMPKPNEALRDFFEDNETFADLFNTYAFGGKQVIQPDDLISADSAYADTVKKAVGVEKIGKYRDLIRKSALGAEFVILALENQDKVHYAMPIKVMLYDVLEYVAECKSLGVTQDSSSWTVDEFLSGISKGTMLTPVFTIVFYTGEKEWDGPRSLHDMVLMNQSIRQFIPDYGLHLIDMGHDRKLSFGSKSLKELNHVLNSIYKEEFNTDKTVVSSSTLSLAGILVNDKHLYERSREGGSVVVCEALNKYWQDGVNKGIEQGIEQGEALRLVKSIEANMRNFHIDLETACKGNDVTVEEYRKAKMCIGEK